MRYTFFYHYNKPASQKAGAPRLSVHYRGACHIVEHLRCNVPCETRIRSKQPRCVMSGLASEVRIHDGICTIL